MTLALLDTHAWVWSLFDQTRLSDAAIAAIEDADAVLVSAISVYEIAQKVRLGKWPALSAWVDQMTRIADQQGARMVDLTADASLTAGLLDWSHRDPFDRLIAATALEQGATLITRDGAFSTLPGLRTLW